MLTWNPLIAAHATAASLAIPVGAVALFTRPGSRLHRLMGARVHKGLGYAWALLMVTAALTGAFIRDFGLPNINGYTPIHLLVLVTLTSVPLAIWFAITKRFEAHRRTMLNTYWGACIVAGAFTLLPNRLLGRWLWHDALGISPATLGQAQGILKATPMWVWVLLVVLLSIGAQQLRSRRVGLVRALAFPLIMLAFAAWGVFSAFGAGLAAAVWAASFMALLPLLARVPMVRGTRWDAWREQLHMPGSVVPLLIIVAVFSLKYTVAVKLGFNPALAHDLNFALPVAATYGAVNALLAARAWQLWRLARPAPPFAAPPTARPLPAAAAVAAVLALTVSVFTPSNGAAQTPLAAVSMGLLQTADTPALQAMLVAYPSRSPEVPQNRGPFEFLAAMGGEPLEPTALHRLPGSGRLVVVSHGTGGNGVPHLDLARALVQAGFVVALPSHAGDDNRDMSQSGPSAWKSRPGEISRAIDAVLARTQTDPRLQGLLPDGANTRVGVYGMSAGGLTALTMGGARWSPAQWVRHCEAHASDDFPTCAGTYARLTGGALDGVKIAGMKLAIRSRFNDEAWYTHTDPRVAAVVANVPMVVPIDLPAFTRSNTQGPVKVGLVTSGHDRWLNPTYHRDALLAACRAASRCEQITHLPTAGHGSSLSPFPLDKLGMDDYTKWLMASPEPVEPRDLLAMNAAIRSFFVRSLGRP